MVGTMAKQVLTPEQHIESADECLGYAETTDDTDWALIQTELAKAHYIAAAVKMANNTFSKPNARVFGNLLKMAR